MRIISNFEAECVAGSALNNPNGRPTKIIEVLQPVYDTMGNVAYSNLVYIEVFDVELEAARERANQAATLTQIYMDELKKKMPGCEHTVNTSGDSQTTSWNGSAGASPSASAGGSITSQRPGTSSRCPHGG
jgi:hypothetical protein